jgi:hypothetical protein
MWRLGLKASSSPGGPQATLATIERLKPMGRIPLCGKHVLLYGPTLRIGLTISQWSSATNFSPLTGIAALAKFYLLKSSFRLAEF